MKRRARRAPSADWLAMTPAQREEMREINFRARANAQSSRFQRESAIEKSFANASPRSSTK